jgi:hypothetical protein
MKSIKCPIKSSPIQVQLQPIIIHSIEKKSEKEENDNIESSSNIINETYASYSGRIIRKCKKNVRIENHLLILR